jgi:hypothetical protein
MREPMAYAAVLGALLLVRAVASVRRGVARLEGAAPVVRVRQFPTLSGRIAETLIESILRDQGLDCRASASDSS